MSKSSVFVCRDPENPFHRVGLDHLAYLVECMMDLFSHIHLVSQWGLYPLSLLRFCPYCSTSWPCDVVWQMWHTCQALTHSLHALGCLLTQLPRSRAWKGSFWSLCVSVLLCDGAFRIMHLCS